MSFPKKLFAFDRAIFFLIAAIAILVIIFGCKNEDKKNYAFAKAETINANEEFAALKHRALSQEWKDYWYDGEAEITSYKLEQARYGELREGTAALIFVTEDFLPEKQVKADQQSDKNIPILKLNATKKFTTGIYPYSVMTSTFYPVQMEMHALKVSQSIQEWCGHTYTQLNNRDRFEMQTHSYFQSEADAQLSIPKAILENELWTQLRIDPMQLPTGNFEIIPDLSFAAMKHVEIKIYSVMGSLTKTSYTLSYPELDRKLVINFSENFPFIIDGWEDTFPDGRDGKKLTTKATKMKTIKSAYWGKNSNDDSSLRTELGLE